MKHTDFAVRAGLLLLCCLGLQSCAIGSSRADAKQKPNVIIILTDDQGYNDVGCYGSFLIKTPNLDKMAAEGVRFTDFYVSSAICTPSRASIMTGCYAQRVSMAEFPRNNPKNDHLGPRHVLHQRSNCGINPDELTIAELMQSQGYATACIGKWHLGHQPEHIPIRHGFDYWFGTPYSNDMNPVWLQRNEEKVEEPIVQDTLTKRYTEEVQRFIETNRDRPFFIYLAHNMPHTPLHASEDFVDRSPRGLYGDAIEEIDWSVGQILETLKKQGLDKDTLVIFTSDNGPWYLRGEDGGSATPLRAAKGATYDGGMRVPCIARWPRRIPEGGVCSEVTTSMDFLPTLAALTNSTDMIEKKIDGKDITSLLEDPDSPSPREVFYYYHQYNLHAVRSGPWKYRAEVPLWEENVYDHRLREYDAQMPEALYYLPTDPGEQKNLMQDHPDVLAKMKALMDEMRGDLGDELTGVKGANIRPRLGD